MKTPWICLFATLAIGGAFAQVPPAEENDDIADQQDAQADQLARDATQAYYTRIAAALAASGQARELAFAATLQSLGAQAPPMDDATDGALDMDDVPSQAVPRDPRIDAWRRQASAHAGKDLLANLLLMQADAPGDGDSRRQAAVRWRALEPDNLAPVFPDAAEPDALWPVAQRITRFDLHWYEQIRWMQATLQAMPPTTAERAALLDGDDVQPDEASAMAAQGIVAATAIPAIKPLMDACRGSALDATPTRRADCRHIAQVMADDSDTSFGTSFGVGMLMNTASTPAEQADATTRRRTLDWQMLQWGKVAESQPNGGTAQFLQALRDPSIHSEHQLVERLLKEAGIPLEPPPEWQAPRG
jgi:hypothetical protein